MSTGREYGGRFYDKAVQLVQAGKRVGMCRIRPLHKGWHCHICERDNPKYYFTEAEVDAWVTCDCGTPFVLIKETA